MDKASIEAMIAAYQAGEPAIKVGRRFGVTLNNVRYHARKAGVWHGKHVVPLDKRFWPKVNKTDQCWLWTGARFPNGYGCFSINHESIGAHRVSFELEHGPIPMGLVLDHTCRNRLCVRPSHLDPVTSLENVKRGMDFLGRKYELKQGRQ